MSTLKVDEILKRTGTGTITVGQSGDTISIPSGATLSVAGSSVTAVDNTPAFEAERTSDQTPSNNTATKIQFNSELFDTDNAYDSSTNHRFTPQTAGKYFVYGSVMGDAESITDLEVNQLMIYKNGSMVVNSAINYGGNDIDFSTVLVHAVMDMNGSSDYLELYVRLKSSNQPTIVGNPDRRTMFGAYKLIGV